MDLNRPHISTTRGALQMGGISATTLAERYGTPLYVTDLDRVVRRYETAMKALLAEYRNSFVAFATKSNSTRGVIDTLSRKGAGATVVSRAGIDLALSCGISPEKVVFDGPSKTQLELAEAIKSGVGMINAESTEEVEDIEALCSQMGVGERRVGFRVNLGIHADTHPGLETGSSRQKFGVARKEVVRFCRDRAKRLRRARVVGLHCHIGSQINDARVFRQETVELVRLADELAGMGVVIEEINVGGGLGVSYKQERALSLDEYAEATAGTLASLLGGMKSKKVRLVFELGRWIVADSTVLLTRVNYLKRAGETNWALVDAGMNDLIRPALYGAYHEIIVAEAKHPSRANVRYSIGGPVCETSDAFGSDRNLGVELSRGDLLAILDTGAYGSSMASNYNMRPLPQTVVLSKGSHKLSE